MTWLVERVERAVVRLLVMLLEVHTWLVELGETGLWLLEVHTWLAEVSGRWRWSS